MIHLSCGSISRLQWTAAGFAALAALFWLISALVKFPPLTWEETGKLPERLKRQSRWSAAAALSAAAAAIIQGVLILTPTCINLG